MQKPKKTKRTIKEKKNKTKLGFDISHFTLFD